MAAKRKTAPVMDLSGRAPRPRTPKVSEGIAREIAAEIVDKNLEPGTALPNEREMVEMFGVGRTTLREALRLLESRGVLTIKAGPGGGPIVRRPTPADLGDGLALLLQFGQGTPAEVLGARTVIEAANARAAALLITDAQVEKLREINAPMLEGFDEIGDFYTANREFHAKIAEAADNVLLRVYLESLAAFADGQVVGIKYSRRTQRAIALGHEAIIEGLAARDPEAAEAAMRKHLEEAAAYWHSNYRSLVAKPIRWLA